MNKIELFSDALPLALFRRLVRAVKAVGMERVEGTYETTFWFPAGAQPCNIAEECVSTLYNELHPGAECIGMEWWLGRLKFGESLPFHTDRDRSLRKLTGEIVHPLWSSILYLNRFPSSPTIVYDQVLAPDGKSWIPSEPEAGRSLEAVPNHYAVFRGDLRHGVVANAVTKEGTNRSGRTTKTPPMRLTFLINYWHRRPAAPNCHDYDGSVYPSFQLKRKGSPRTLAAA
jgi:hypothetical protein